MKTLNKILKLDKEKFKIPKCVQDIIPIKAIWEDGIFQVSKNKFSKSYKFMDINLSLIHISIANIKRRILEEQSVRVPFIENVYNYRKVNYPFAKRHKRAKAKGFIALYYHYCYLLKVFPNNVPQQKLPPSIRADVSRMEQLSEEARFLATHKIKTFEELSNYQDDVSFKIKMCIRDRWYMG